MAVADGAVHVTLSGAPPVTFSLPEALKPGPLLFTRDVRGAHLNVMIPVLEGSDFGFEREGVQVRFPGFSRMGKPRSDGIPVLVAGKPRIVTEAGGRGVTANPTVKVESTESRIRLTWDSIPGARWIVSRETGGVRKVLTPVPLENPVFTMTGLSPLSEVELMVSRLGGSGETRVTARTSFPFQRGFPQRIGANMTSIQVLDLDRRHGREIVFGDDEKGIWALHADGSEVRHAGDNWTFGLFAAIPHGVFEPVVSRFGRRRAILATSKLDDRGLYAFDLSGKPLPGFPVRFRSRLMTPPLVGNFDGKRGNEALVVSGFGKTIDLVHPDGKVEPYAKIGRYNYGYPIAADVDRDRTFEVILLDGQGRVHLLDKGKEHPGFPVDLGSPGRATPILADVDGDRKPEIIAVGRGTTHLAAVDIDGDRRDEIFLTLSTGGIWGLTPAGKMLPGFPLRTKADLYAPPLLTDLDGDGDLELFVGAGDGVLRVWDLPYRVRRRHPTWPGLLGGSGMPGVPGR